MTHGEPAQPTTTDGGTAWAAGVRAMTHAEPAQPTTTDGATAWAAGVRAMRCQSNSDHHGGS